MNLGSDGLTDAERKGFLDSFNAVRVPRYLMDMPKRVLFGSCKGLEKWCRDNDKVRPTLLDLDRARRARKGERR